MSDQKISKELRPLLERAYKELKKGKAQIKKLQAQNSSPIAIVGVGCRFPAAPNPESFWTQLCQGNDLVRERSPQRNLLTPGFEEPSSLKWCGYLEEVDQFDPSFFGLSPVEAENMDPQQRLMMMVVWEALENAGLVPQSLRGQSVGVFIGVSGHDYAHLIWGSSNPLSVYGGTGNASSIVANRLSYFFDFRGPSVSIDTACSSSLVAVHQAVQSLRSGESNLSIVGGVNLVLFPSISKVFHESGFLSPDGRCQSFDSKANGYVRSEGCGAVILKRLDDALKDQDQILAVIKGSAVNQDGQSNGLTAPNGPSQEAVIQAALQNAKVSPDEINYIETHGTGTPLGDPIEIHAIRNVLAKGRAPETPLLIGAVKSNMGHLEAAAGIAGLIKTTLALHHQFLPANLHFRELNPAIRLEGAPLHFVSENQKWTSENEKPRLAGISSFGFGGTNAHLILGEAPQALSATAETKREHHIFNLSAKTSAALRSMAVHSLHYLENNPEASLASVCHTQNQHRSHFRHRLAIVGENISDLQTQLQSFLHGEDEEIHSVQIPRNPQHKVGFVFSGQGCQYLGMGKALYESQPHFREVIDQCSQALHGLLDRPLDQLLYADLPDNAELLSRSEYLQPAIGSVQYAIASLWKSWGIVPEFVMGSSIGEFAAAAIAGTLPLRDMVRLLYYRGVITGQTAGDGAMASVFVDPETAQELVVGYEGKVEIAAFNGPGQTVLSGFIAPLKELCAQLEQKGIAYKYLEVPLAFHSPVMEPVLDKWQEELQKYDFQAPGIPFISTVTGKAEREALTDSSYWVNHLRNPIQFTAAIKGFPGGSPLALLETSPRPTLLPLISEAAEDDSIDLFPSLHPRRKNWETMMASVVELYKLGIEIDWKSLNRGFKSGFSNLPTYPFELSSYWPENVNAKAPASTDTRITPLETSVDSPEISASPVLETAHQVMDPDQILSILKDLIGKLLKMPSDKVDADAPFLEMGADSLILVGALRKIEKRFQIKITIQQIFNSLKTIQQLTDHLFAQQSEKGFSVQNTRSNARSSVSSPSLDIRKDSQPKAKPKSIFPQRETVAPTKGLPPKQQDHLDALIARYTAKTTLSKAHTQKYRAQLADNRTSAGFRFSIKEMLYPIIGESSKGSRLWDLDGNEYLDIAMGFGVNLFGHQPEFITDAITSQLAKGMQLGVQSGLAGEVAELIHQLTGVERVTFCNSGTEAIMTALRLARTFTKRDKVVIFKGSYHGHFDGTLAFSDIDLGDPQGMPFAPGITQGMVSDVLVLEYGTDATLELLEHYADEIAAVLVSPVQSRRPDLQPKRFLKALRQFCDGQDTLLIFDEIITGFRIHPGGAQAHFDITADLVAYGKVVGGGLPIGVVAGKSPIMDGVDGGMWSFGDQSFPGAETTFFAGTFCKHPLAMASAKAILTEMKEKGPGLQNGLNLRTREFVNRTNTFFQQYGYPVEIKHFGSLFYFSFSGNMDLFFYHLLDQGIFVWEGRTCFLSLAHSPEDVAFLERAIRTAANSLREGGFVPAQELVSPVLQSEVLDVPATIAQKQLWLSTLMGTDGLLAYNIRSRLHLKGDLQVQLLQKAIQNLVDRHEALRSYFSDSGEVRHIREKLEVLLIEIDLSQYSKESQAQQLTELDKEDSLGLFDLTQAPPFRCTLIRLSETEQVFMLTAHHILADGWSLGLMLEEIFELYNSYLLGREPDLSKPVQARELAIVKETDSYQSQGQVSKQYWLDQFSDRLPLLELPTDLPPPEHYDLKANKISVVLDSEQYQAVRKTGEQLGVTGFMTLFSAFAVLMHRLSGQEAIVLGVPTSNRSLPDSEKIITYLANLLPIITEIESEQSFADFIAQTQSTILDGFSHESYPFAQLFDEIRESRSLGDAPMINATFNLNGAVELVGSGLLETAPLDAQLACSPFSIMFDLSPQGTGLIIDCHYHSNRFSEGLMRSLLQQYVSLLKAICKAPHTEILKLDVLSSEERDRLLHQFNDTRSAYPDEHSIPDLFREIAASHADKIAVRYRDVKLTYQEVESQSNHIAQAIVALQPEHRDKPMAIFLSPGISMLPVLLGAMKSGRPYVPVAPDLPKERISFILRDSGSVLLITDQREIDAGLPDISIPVLDYSSISFSQEAEAPSNGPGPDDTVYYIYTSGSTGVPKGCLISHRNVIRLVKAEKFPYDFGVEDKWVLAHSYGFDVSVWEMFGCLLRGAELLIPDREVVRDPQKFVDFLSNSQANILHQTPQAFYGLSRIAIAENIPLGDHLRFVIFAGDKLDPGRLREWTDRFPLDQVCLVNMFGISETTVYSTYHILQESDINSHVSCIGGPLPETSLYVLDSKRNLLPLGWPGELYLGGTGVGQGYLNRPELNEERFLPDPFSPGSTMYRTGDQVRWQKDGTLEYLGRLDTQIKIRGYRVEPTEIAHYLGSHPDIQECHVIYLKQPPTFDCLVAYFVSSEEAPSKGSLRSFLLEQLPEYMVPSFFVQLEAIPLNNSNKVDKNRLPLPSFEGQNVQYLPPSTSEEIALAEIWEEILGVDGIGVENNFFDMGGHSLKAAQLVSRIKFSFQVSLELMDIFRTPTIAGQVKLLDREKTLELAPLTPALQQDTYPLSAAQNRFWLMSQFGQAGTAYNVPAAFVISGPLDSSAFRKAYRLLVSRHESLRTTFVVEQGSPRQKILSSASFDLEVFDFQNESEPVQKAQALAQERSEILFSLTEDKLINGFLAQCEEHKHFFFLCIHHIICDDWSLGLLFEELMDLYAVVLNQKERELVPPTLQYKDFAVWENGLQTDSTFLAEQNYWKTRLSPPPPSLNLQTDYPRPLRKTYTGNSLSLSLSGDLKLRVQQFASAQQSTSFSVFLSAIKILLFRYTQESDITVGVPASVRPVPETEDLIGVFLNTLPVRSQLEGQQSYIDFLKQLTLDFQGDLGHQAYPFDRMLADVQASSDNHISDLFDIMVVQGEHDFRQRTIGALDIQKADLRIETSKFDLVFSFMDLAENAELKLEYNSDIFTEFTAAGFLKAFQTLIFAILEQPFVSIDALPLLKADVKSRMLEELNRTTQAFPKEKTLVDLFNETVAEFPDQVALKGEFGTSTYRELSEKANRVSQSIQKAAPGLKQAHIAVLIQPSDAFVAVILGILQAGHAYVPLAPELPAERISFILEDSDCALLVADPGLRSSKLPDCKTPVLENREWEPLKSEVFIKQNPHSPQDTAYIIYTSGSTGKPKGCLVSHSNVVSLIKTDSLPFDFHRKDIWVLAHAIGFDFSVWEIFAPLLTGGSLAIPSRELVKDTRKFCEFLVDNKVSVLNQTPEAFYLLAKVAVGMDAPLDQFLRFVIFGGDKLLPSQLVEWAKRYPLDQVNMVNMFGITETTVHVTFHLLTDDDLNSHLSPIGYPLSEVTTYVLDAQQNLLPKGWPGELYVGGAGVCKGYFRRPELTAERFVPNPFAPGEKIYRTGDGGRWLHDGGLEYLGRLDSQIQIAGHRVEPTEVGYYLNTHPQVANCEVIYHRENPELAYLVAYWVPTEGRSSSPDLKDFLGQHLPYYMLPLRFIELETIPLTANGKVDKKRLPLPALNEGSGAGRKIAPRNPLEQTIHQAWMEIFGKDSGIHEDFFELGGNSLRAAQLVSRIANATGTEIGLARIFEAPTIALQAEAVRQGNPSEFTQIEPAPVAPLYELSAAQSRLWILDQFSEADSAYNVPSAFMVRGKIDPDALEKALTSLIQRHEILRTGIELQAGVPMQKIISGLEFELPVHDFSKEFSPLSKAQNLAEKEIQVPFELSQPPLIRAFLAQLDHESDFIFLNLHHIVCDHWSLGIAIEELSTLYAEIALGESVEWEPIQIQYKDYAFWQRNWLEGPNALTLAEFWKTKLLPLPGVLNLPTDFQRPSQPSFAGQTISVPFPEDLIRPLQQLAHTHSTSLFLVFLSLVKVLLYKYTRQGDITVGVPISGRTQAPFEKIMGLFLNTLPLRTFVEGTLSYPDFLKQLSTDSLEAFAHQEYPLDRMIDDLDLHGNAARSSLFDVIVVMVESQDDEFKLGNLELQSVQLPTHTSKFDLTFTFSKKASGGDLNIEFNSDIFEPQRVCAMAKHLRQMAYEVGYNAERTLEEIPILPQEEAVQIAQFQDPERMAGQNASIVEMIEDRVRKMPDATASEFGDSKLSYAELNGKANRLAHWLREEGNLQPGEAVTVWLPRGETIVWAMLGILKAGGAYVPLAPDLPENRFDFCLRNCGSRFLLVANKPIQSFPLPESVQLLDLNCLNPSLPAFDPKIKLAPAAPSFIIYTSGSTGVPKGVVQNHSCLSNLIIWNTELMGENHRILQFSALGFDASIHEILFSLASGGTLVIPEHESHKDPHQLIQLWIDGKVTVTWCIPPAYLNKLASFPELINAENLSLQHIVSTGEQLKAGTDLRNFLASRPSITLHNFYGPSETHVVTALTMEGGHVPPLPGIGTPIRKTQVYILDPLGKPVPVGIPGELYFGGDNVGIGYLNLPELTEERFLTPGFANGNRVYRTGDLGHWNPDGSITFLGRSDHQVKIRGFRVEPEEVEQVLLGHESIRECLVISRENEIPETELVAYLIARDPADQPATTQLRDFLRGTLPAYMVPGHFVFLEEFPITSNGKLDRRALPAPQLDLAFSQREISQPETAIERRLLNIWEDVFRKSPLSTDDNFFDIGGHSLSAVKLVARIHKEFDAKIRLQDINASPTIRQLARLVEHSEQEVFQSIPLLPKALSYPVSTAQRRLWVLCQFNPEHVAYNLPTAYQLIGAVNEIALSQAVNALLERHESLRTCFGIVDDELRQFILDSWEVPLQLLDLSEEEDSWKAGQKHIQKASVQPFDLQKGPLLRVTLIRLEQEVHLLLLNAHHIVGDGWSAHTLIKEFGLFYNAFQSGESLDLPPLRIHYKEYAAWSLARQQSDKFKKDRAFWHQLLSDQVPSLDIPADFSRPAVKSYRGCTVEYEFPAKVYQVLKELSASEEVTLFTCLLTFVNVLLYRYSGQEDLILGTFSGSRPHVDLENQVGFYVNLLVLRNRLNAAASLKTTLHEVNERGLAAFAHQEYPFDLLVQELELERDMSRNPLFDVGIQHLDAMPEVPAISSLNISKKDLELDVSKYDLLFSFFENEESIHLSIEYDTDLFLPERIQRLFLHLETLILSGTKDLGQTVGSVNLIPPGEMSLLRSQFPGKILEYDRDQSVLDLISAQSNAQPDQVILVCGDKSYTYRDLENKSNAIAAQLITRAKLRPNIPVAVMLPRTEFLLISLLGVLKAGVPYLGIPTDYPKGRIQYMLDDSNVQTIVVDATSIGLLPNSKDWDVLNLTHLPSQAPEKALHPPKLSSGDLAYVTYTSGSTGAPKGVQITHASLLSLLTWLCDEYEGDNLGTVYASSPIAFDTSVLENFYPFVSGTKVRVLDSPIEIPQYLDQDQNILLNTVPSVIQNLIEINSQFENVVSINMAGESIPQIVMDNLPTTGIHIRNLYGPAEYTVYSTFYPFKGDHSRVLIGKPLPNTDILILDEGGQLAPIGIPGELYISGAGLMAGYLNKPEMNAKHLLPHPDSPDQLMYRTGDFGYWLVDGNIQFLGRRDNQIKLLGKRVELGEIEHALTKIPGIERAVVVRTTDGAALRAFYTFVEEEISSRNLVANLSESLPGHMVPRSFHPLSEMPLSPNGKINRLQLETLEVVEEFTEPEDKALSPVAIRLRGIWEKVLKHGNLNASDSFFKVGGQSLKVMQLAYLIGQEFGVEIDISTLFSHVTIQQQADWISAQQPDLVPLEDIPIGPVQEEYPIAPVQERLWNFHQRGESVAGFNIPIPIEIQGKLNVSFLEAAFNHTIAQHASLRTSFHLSEGHPVQRIMANAEVKFRVIKANLDNDPLDQYDDLFSEEQRWVFDLEKAPLIRATVLECHPERYLILFNFHHLIIDGFSLNVFYPDLFANYKALLEGQALPTVSKQLSYADYVLWNQTQSSEPHFDQARTYWEQKFAHPWNALQLPADRARPQKKSFKGETLFFKLDPDLHLPWQTVGNAAGCSLFMSLSSLVNVLLHLYTGEEDLITGTIGSGRNHPQLESIIGLFTNVLAMRTTVDKASSFYEALQATKTEISNSIKFQEYPYVHLEQSLDLVRDPSRTPIFDVMLLMQDFMERLDLPGGLISKPLRFYPKYGRRDLIFTFGIRDRCLQIEVEFNLDIFDRPRIIALCKDFQTLLVAAGKSPHAPIISMKNQLINKLIHHPS